MGMRRRMVGAAVTTGVAVIAALGGATAVWAETPDDAEISVQVQPESSGDPLAELVDPEPTAVEPEPTVVEREPTAVEQPAPAVEDTPAVEVLDPGGSSVVDPSSGGTIVLGPAVQASSGPAPKPHRPAPAAGPVVLGPAVEASVVTRTLSPGTVAAPDGLIVLGPAVEATVRTRVLSTGSESAPRAHRAAAVSSQSVSEAAVPAAPSVAPPVEPTVDARPDSTTV